MMYVFTAHKCGSVSGGGGSSPVTLSFVRSGTLFLCVEMLNVEKKPAAVARCRAVSANTSPRSSSTVQTLNPITVCGA